MREGIAVVTLRLGYTVDDDEGELESLIEETIAISNYEGVHVDRYGTEVEIETEEKTFEERLEEHRDVIAKKSGLE